MTHPPVGSCDSLLRGVSIALVTSDLTSDVRLWNITVLRRAIMLILWQESDPNSHNLIEQQYT